MASVHRPITRTSLASRRDAGQTNDQKGDAAMADLNTPTDADAGATPTADAIDTNTTDDEKLGDAGKSALDAERRARKAAEKQLREAAERLKSYEDANKSDLEKATSGWEAEKSRADQLAARLADRDKADAIRTAAVDAKAIDADVIVALVSSAITLDDNGTPVGIAEAINDLKARKPVLFDETPHGYADGSPKGRTAAPKTTADAFAQATRTF